MPEPSPSSRIQKEGNLNLTPLELRTRLLDEVVRTLDPYRQQRPLPFTGVSLHLLVPVQRDQALYLAAFDELDPPFDVAVRQRLKEAGFGVPAVFAVDQRLYEEVPEDLKAAFNKYGPLYVEPNQVLPQTRALLSVLRGRAEETAYELVSTKRYNVGRMRQVVDDRARVFRRNDVVFLDPADDALSEEEQAINQTVSREHAYIAFDERKGQFLWYNEKGSTSINRTSYRRPMPVGTQPVPLEDGDELYLGQAYLVFKLGPGKGPDRKPDRA